MDQIDIILNNIKQNPKSELHNVSDEEMRQMLNATITAIDSLLDSGNQVDIEDFGVFSRRKRGDTSVSFFKPSERLNDRITRKK